MSNTDTNKQDDTDVLRAEDIVPPYNTEPCREQDLSAPATDQRKDISSQNGQNHLLKETTSSFIARQTQHVETGATEPADIVQETSEIPKFDLAEQIMAEQRKITAIRRKAPGRKLKTPDQQYQILSTGYAIKQSPPVLSEKDLIIAEIVARDIEKLYRGDCSNLRNW